MRMHLPTVLQFHSANLMVINYETFTSYQGLHISTSHVNSD